MKGLKTAKVKRLCLGIESEKIISEQCADGYACHQIEKEFSSDESVLTNLERIKEEKRKNGWPCILPSDMEYINRYPG